MDSRREAELGGAGTPGVQELGVWELGVARQVHTNSARAVRCARSQAKAWVGHKVAVLSRHLALEVVHVVDAAVADAICGQSPGRVRDLAAALPGVSRADGTGLRSVIARVSTADAFGVDATVSRVAEILLRSPTRLRGACC